MENVPRTRNNDSDLSPLSFSNCAFDLSESIQHAFTATTLTHTRTFQTCIFSMIYFAIIIKTLSQLMSDII